VYVLPGHRGTGLGQALVRMMVDEGPGAGKRWMLHTSDAHGLYRSFGFARPDGRYLERERSGTRSAEAVQLTGKHVRLEPLGHRHGPALVAAAADGGDVYRWTTVPRDIDQARSYVETALAARDSGTAVPFAVVRNEDDTVIGSTRFWNLDYWPWPDRKPTGTPDTCEIGHTWLSRDAIRTAANTEMKQLMLTHAFETWQVQSVCLHTASQNDRSREAMERLGARFEGVLRAHRLGANGAPRDSVRFSITAAEWPEVRRHLAELSARYA
jgi:RimJ/RimL family protein N-acetyltransferase